MRGNWFKVVQLISAQVTTSVAIAIAILIARVFVLTPSYLKHAPQISADCKNSQGGSPYCAPQGWSTHFPVRDHHLESVSSRAGLGTTIQFRLVNGGPNLGR